MNKRSYVVTGGAGFIGSHIAARLLQDHHTVRVIDNLSTGRHENLDYLRGLDGDLTIHHTDITDADALYPIFRGAEVVFHHAALASVPMSIEDPLRTHHHCATGTLNVLTTAHNVGVRRVVYAASSSAYGDSAAEYKRETMLPDPVSPYGVAKLAGEYYCRMFYDVYGLETVALRYFNVFGARQDPTSQYAAVIPIFVTRMLQGKAPVIFGTGEQSRDFVHVDNVVHGNLLAADAQSAVGDVINLATGSQITINELVHKLNTILGTSIDADYADARPGDILHSSADITKAQQLLNFSPIVDFDEGLSRTVAWYRERHSTNE